MSVNDTGAECYECGSYNCQYLCIECVYKLLRIIGIPKDKALNILENRLEDWEVKEVEAQIEKELAKG